MKITELIQDLHNANKGTKRGQKAVSESLQRYGAGRSILIDKDGRIIAGNKTAANAADAGLDDVIVVQSDGSKIIAVQRTDLTLDDAKAKELAIADNRTAELGLEWDSDVLAEFSTELDLEPFFAEHELADITGQVNEPANDAAAEWEGMPEYASEDKMGVQNIIVHFASHEAVEKFARLMKQPISPSTKYIWFPRSERLDLQSLKYK